jgi:DNA replication protein DnaC
MAAPDIIHQNSLLSDTESQSCTICYNTGWERVGNLGVRPCSICRNRSKYSILLDSARIPERYIHCTLDDYAPQNEEQQHVIRFCKSFINGYHNSCKGILFLGPCGVGKTHLAVALIKELMRQKNARCLFYDLRDLLKEIQDAYNSGASEKDIVAPIYRVDVLVLDELGATRPTDWVHETVTHIINTRYNEKKVTILTSNFLDNPVLTKEDIRNGNRSAEETLSQRIGVRLRSRLYEMCWLIDIKGYDYRDSRNRQPDSLATDRPVSATDKVIDNLIAKASPETVAGSNSTVTTKLSPQSLTLDPTAPTKPEMLVQQHLMGLENAKNYISETQPTALPETAKYQHQKKRAQTDDLTNLAKNSRLKQPQPLGVLAEKPLETQSASISIYHDNPTKYNK